MGALLDLIPGGFVGKWIAAGIAALLVVSAITYGVHSYNESMRVEGDKRTEARLQPIIDATRERAAKLTLDYYAMSDKAATAERERDAKARTDAVPLDAAVARVRAGSFVAVPFDVARVRDAASAFANGGPSYAASAAVASPAVSTAAEGEVETFDAVEWAGYDRDAAKAYRSAVDDSLLCRGRYDGARAAQAAAQPKGTQ